MRRYFAAGAFLTVGLVSHPALATDYSVVNGVVKELGQESESVTYGSFKAGAYRDIYDVPTNYGALISVTSDTNGGATFWFQDNQGNLRNVEISDVSKPLIIHRLGTAEVQ